MRTPRITKLHKAFRRFLGTNSQQLYCEEAFAYLDEYVELELKQVQELERTRNKVLSRSRSRLLQQRFSTLSRRFRRASLSERTDKRIQQMRNHLMNCSACREDHNGLLAFMLHRTKLMILSRQL